MNKKKFLVEAICGFCLWTAILSPYVLLVTQMTPEQYLTWLGMQGIIVPPVSIFVINITNKITGLLK